MAKIVKDSSIVKRPSGKGGQQVVGNRREFCLLNRAQGNAGRGLVGRIFRHAQVADTAVCLDLKCHRGRADTDQVHLCVDVMIPARTDRVLNEFFVAALRSANRIHGGAAAVVDSAPDNRLLLEISIAGSRGRRRRRGLRRWGGSLRWHGNLGLLLGLGWGGDRRRSLGQERELVRRGRGRSGRNGFIRRRLLFRGRGRAGFRLGSGAGVGEGILVFLQVHEGSIFSVLTWEADCFPSRPFPRRQSNSHSLQRSSPSVRQRICARDRPLSSADFSGRAEAASVREAA